MFIDHDHYCQDTDNYDTNLFFQKGRGIGSKVLLLGESPAKNGWRISGKACYTPEGRLLPTGKRLNELLSPFNLAVDICSFTELAKCFVGKDRHLLLQCSQKCWPILKDQLKSKDIELIIILGVNTLNIFNAVNSSHLKIGEMSETTINGEKYSLLPIYHPSPINPHGRQKNLEIFSKNEEAIRHIIS